MTDQEAARLTADWLRRSVVEDARGSSRDRLDTAPEGRYWLGKLATEEEQIRLARGDRGERLDPCALGVRFQPPGSGPWNVEVEVSFAVWRGAEDDWQKAGPIAISAVLTIGDDDETHLGTELQLALAELSESNLLDAEIRTETPIATPLRYWSSRAPRGEGPTPGCTRSG